MSSHSGIIGSTDISDHQMDITHVPHQLNLCLVRSVEFFELLNEGFSHGYQSLLGPGQEPINRAFVEEGWELSEPISELLSHWGEAQAHMEIVSNSIHEVVVELACRWILSLEFLHVLVSGITQESLSFILG